MPRTPTTPSQVSGHRFLIRRIEHALVRADSRMLHDPLRTRSRAVLIGATLVILLLAGTAVLSLVRPQGGSAAGEQLIVVAGSEALHVRVNDRLHPVANLVSARLILGNPAEPKRVRANSLDNEQIGFPIGIEGAPLVPARQANQGNQASKSNRWGREGEADVPGGGAEAAGQLALSICERVDQELGGATFVAESLVRMEDIEDTLDATLSRADSAVVTDGRGQWLVSQGFRSPLSTSHPEHAAVSRALGLEQAVVRPVGAAFLRAVPEVPPLAAPPIEGRGQPTRFAAPFDTVGNVVQVGQRRVVVLVDGAASISPVMAELLAAHGAVAQATEGALAAVPVAVAPTVPGLPDEPLQFVAATDWLCAGRVAEQDRALVDAVKQRPGGRYVEYPHADGRGEAVDGFMDARVGRRDTIAVAVQGAVHVISPEGTRFAVHNRTALAAMGFNATTDIAAGGPRPVEWEVLAALRGGPELSKQAALGPLAARDNSAAGVSPEAQEQPAPDAE